MRGKVKRGRKRAGKRPRAVSPGGERRRRASVGKQEFPEASRGAQNTKAGGTSVESRETACPKCGSLMVPERFIDYQQTGEATFNGWRCLSCGLILDPLILSHRVKRREEAPGLPEELFESVGA